MPTDSVTGFLTRSFREQTRHDRSQEMESKRVYQLRAEREQEQFKPTNQPQTLISKNAREGYQHDYTAPGY